MEHTIEGYKNLSFIKNIPTTFKGEVCLANSPSDFYINKLGDRESSDFEFLLKDMNSFYKNYGSRYVVEKIFPGMLVAVYYYEIWMRGIVYMPTNDSQWKIIIMDNADKIITKPNSLRLLLTRFTKLSIQAIPAKLGFIYPNGESWSAEAISFFRHELLDKEMIIHLVFSEYKSDGRFVVTLADTSGNSFDKQLVKYGFAILPGQKIKAELERNYETSQMPQVQAEDDSHTPWLDIFCYVPPPDKEKSSTKMNPDAPVYKPSPLLARKAPPSIDEIEITPPKQDTTETNEEFVEPPDSDIIENNSSHDPNSNKFSTTADTSQPESSHVSISLNSSAMELTLNTTPVTQTHPRPVTFPGSYPAVPSIRSLMECNIPSPSPPRNRMPHQFNFAPNVLPAPPGFNPYMNQHIPPPGFNNFYGVSLQTYQQLSFPFQNPVLNHDFWKR